MSDAFEPWTEREDREVRELVEGENARRLCSAIEEGSKWWEGRFKLVGEATVMFVDREGRETVRVLG